MTMTLSLEAAPAWASISASGVLSVAPTAPLGAQALTIRATDGASTATKQVTVTVTTAGETLYARLTHKVSSGLVLSLSTRRTVRNEAAALVRLGFASSRLGEFGESVLQLAFSARAGV